MVSYVPKKRKAVILLSTMHHDEAIYEESCKTKPVMIKHYYKTKCEIDVAFDQMIQTYYV